MADQTAPKILIGDCLTSLRTLPDQFVHTCVTSPPYFGLRDYGRDGQIGLEDTPEAFVARLVEVFREVRRVLRDDGTLWLNLGDSYAQQGGRGEQGATSARKGRSNVEAQQKRASMAPPAGLKPKDLVGIPWRVAFALQADGWFLRQDIIWHKPNPMPESVTDRCTKAHEYLFLLSKSARYYFDGEAIKEPAVKGAAGSTFHAGKIGAHQMGRASTAERAECGTRNRRSVWSVTTKPFKGAHFATFPPDLIEPCILAGAPERCCAKCGAPHERITSRSAEPPRVEGSDLDRFGNGDPGVHRKVGGQYQKWLDANPKQTVGWSQTCACDSEVVGGVVLDPFGGSGTTAGVALRHGRQAILCELNPDYAALMPDRVASIVNAGKPAKKTAAAHVAAENDNQMDLMQWART